MLHKVLYIFRKSFSFCFHFDLMRTSKILNYYIKSLYCTNINRKCLECHDNRFERLCDAISVPDTIRQIRIPEFLFLKSKEAE